MIRVTICDSVVSTFYTWKKTKSAKLPQEWNAFENMLAEIKLTSKQIFFFYIYLV